MRTKQLLTLLLAVAGLIPTVAEAQEPAGRVAIVGTSFDYDESEFAEGETCYMYLAAKGKIKYIEESFRADGAYLNIGYLYDEKGEFKSAVARWEEPFENPPDDSNLLLRSQKGFRPHETFIFERLGIKKDISAMAEEAFATCNAHMEKQAIATLTPEKQLKHISGFLAVTKEAPIANISYADGSYWVTTMSYANISSVGLQHRSYDVFGNKSRGFATSRMTGYFGDNISRFMPEYKPMNEALTHLTPDFLSANLPGDGWIITNIGAVPPETDTEAWAWGVTFHCGEQGKNFLFRSGAWEPSTKQSDSFSYEK